MPVPVGSDLVRISSGVSAFTLGGGGSGLFASVLVDFTTPSSARFFEVTVTGATTGMRVVGSASLSTPAGVAEDELEMDPITVSGRVSATDTVRLLVSSSSVLFGQRLISLSLGV